MVERSRSGAAAERPHADRPGADGPRRAPGPWRADRRHESALLAAGQRSAITIGGNRPNANYFLLDGATNTDPTFNTQNLSPSPDAVQEFQVQTGSYSAEMGGAGGGQINIVTRSGTEQFHGTAYEFLAQRRAGRAHLERNARQRITCVQNNFGASLGGPLFGEEDILLRQLRRLPRRRWRRP